MSDDETFESADAGSSLTYPVSAGSLKKGDHVCINNKPCKIVDISTSKTGKHGHAKANITGIDIFTGKKLEEVSPTSHSLPSPWVTRKEYTVADIDDTQLTLMDADGEMREDLNLPEDETLRSQIIKDFEGAEGKDVVLAVIGAMGTEQVISAALREQK